MALIRALTASSGGGGEKPALLWSDASGTNSTISVDHSAYQYLILICGINTSGFPLTKKTTLCDKTQALHELAMATVGRTSGYTWMTAQISTGSVSFPQKEANYCLCYAVYGCNSLSIDYTDIWNDWNVA